MARKKRKFDFTPSPYQEKIFDFVEHGVGNAVIKACAGSGKCLGFDTEILMYDGSVKKVQDVVVGDLLMGDDSTPRTVLSTTQGVSNLKLIVPKKGKSWVCNDVHILTLAKYFPAGYKQTCGHYETVDLSIDSTELQKASKHKDNFYRNYKLLKTGVDFPTKSIPIDPWLYGIWLGDGTTSNSSITNVDTEIIEEIKRRVPAQHYVSVKKYKQQAPLITILCESHKKNQNLVRQFLRTSSNKDGKFINRDYLINDKDTRLKLLAGLIDSDGYYARNNYYITTKFKKMCDDIVFLARSLGLGANFSFKEKTCYNNGVSKKYYHITINGDLTQIPVILKRKTATPRLIKKNHLHTGFKIEDNGYGNYYGFELDGNGRFLLADFTITHNTKTIVSAIQLIPKSKKCLFIAFNRAIAGELKEKVKSNSNCDVRTIHSLGYLMLRRNFGNEIEIDEYKYRSYIKNHISELSSINDDFVMSPDSIREYIDNIATLVDYARFNLAQSVLDIEGIADKYSIPVSFDECEVAKKCMEWGRDNHMTVDYTDMVWLPTELSLRPMGLQFDWILFDECQDASLMSIQLFLKCFKRGTRFIAVGDSDQCIYYFAGSSTEAFDYMCRYPNTTVFPLPITYRCPKVITEFAQQIVPEITARDDAPEGEIIYDCPISMINDGDMVLCRSKAPLVQLYTKLLRRNITCYIKGQDMGANLIKMIEDIDCEKLNAGLQGDGLFVRLFTRLFEERDKMMAKRNINLSDASLSMYIMSMYDSINTLSILAERCRNKKELIRHIEQIFKEESEGVCLSTIHKAKGLENDNVYILCNSSMPSKLAKKEWEKRQERNIQYVAYTRAKQRMGFVSENEISPSGSISEPIAILNDLHNIELQLQRITGRKPTEDSTNIKLTEFRLKNVTKVDENVNNDNVVELTQEENDDMSTNNDDILLQLADFLKRDDGNIDKLKNFLNS